MGDVPTSLLLALWAQADSLAVSVKGLDKILSVAR